MRRALDDLLPETVRWRGGKADLSPNFYRSLLRDERSVLDRIIDEDPSYIEPYVDVSALRDAYREYETIETTEAGMYIWKAVTMDRWLRQLHDK